MIGLPTNFDFTKLFVLYPKQLFHFGILCCRLSKLSANIAVPMNINQCHYATLLRYDVTKKMLYDYDDLRGYRGIFVVFRLTPHLKHSYTVKLQPSSIKTLKQEIFSAVEKMSFFPYPDFLKTFNSQNLSQRLIIPSDYRQYYPTTLPQTAVIRKAEGNFWTVKWTITQDETISFEDGWHKFVTDHRLIDGDFLLFTYDGSRSFWVRIYRNGLILKAETPIKVQEISDDDDDGDGDGDGDYDPEKGEDSDEKMIISLSVGSSSEDYTDDITSSEVNKAPLEKGGSSQKQRAASIGDPDMYLDDPSNPCFIAAASCSKRLVIATQVIKDWNLKFGGTVNLIDQFGELKAKVGEWKDRLVAYKWNKIYKRNGATCEDTIICEIIREGGVVQSIKPHFVMK